MSWQGLVWWLSARRTWPELTLHTAAAQQAWILDTVTVFIAAWNKVLVMETL